MVRIGNARIRHTRNSYFLEHSSNYKSDVAIMNFIHLNITGQLNVTLVGSLERFVQRGSLAITLQEVVLPRIFVVMMELIIVLHVPTIIVIQRQIFR